MKLIGKCLQLAWHSWQQSHRVCSNDDRSLDRISVIGLLGKTGIGEAAFIFSTLGETRLKQHVRPRDRTIGTSPPFVGRITEYQY